MRTLLSLSAIVGLLLYGTGCGTNRATVIDSSADVVRLGPNVYGSVYVWNEATKAWTLTGKIHLPEGWYAGPPPP